MRNLIRNIRALSQFICRDSVLLTANLSLHIGNNNTANPLEGQVTCDTINKRFLRFFNKGPNNYVQHEPYSKLLQM